MFAAETMFPGLGKLGRSDTGRIRIRYMKIIAAEGVEGVKFLLVNKQTKLFIVVMHLIVV